MVNNLDDQDIYSGSYGNEPAPLDNDSKEYEDVATIARIGSADMNLSAKFQVFHQEVLENFYRLAGHIYSAQDLKKLTLEKRPNFEWNLFLPIILGIVGNFKGSIPGVDFYPDGESVMGQQGAQLQKQLSDYILFQANDIEYEIAKSFLYAVVARIGWLKSSWSYRNDDQGNVLVEWYDSLRLKFDTNWRRRDLTDMRYMDDSGWYEASEIIDIYAKKNEKLRKLIYERATLIVGETAMKKGKLKKMLMTWAERFLNDSIDYQGRKHGFDTFNTSDLVYNYGGVWYNAEGRFKVVDWYERRPQPRMIITEMESGKQQDITELIEVDKNDPWRDVRRWYEPEKLQQVRAQYKDPKVAQEWREIIWQTTVVPALNLKLYDAAQKIQCKQYKFSPILAYDFHPDILETRSVMDNIIDPVSSYNLRRNTILTYIMKMTQGGWIAEESAVKGFEDELMSNELVSLTKVANGAISGQKLQKKEPPVFPAALAAEAQMEKEDTQLITGQSPNVRGAKESAKETGVLFQQRVQQANIMQEWLADNAQYALVMVARYNLALVQRYMSMPRSILILGDEDNPQWLQLNQRILGRILNDVSYGKYSLRIAKQPYGKKARDMEFQKIMGVNQWLESLDKSYVEPTIALKLSGLSVKNEMIAHIKKVQQSIAQQAGQQQQQQQSAQQNAQQMQQEQLQLARNHQKIQLLKGLNELHNSTLENRNLSNELAQKALVGGIVNQAA